MRPESLVDVGQDAVCRDQDGGLGIGVVLRQEAKGAAERIRAAVAKKGRTSLAVADLTALLSNATVLGRFIPE